MQRILAYRFHMCKFISLLNFVPLNHFKALLDIERKEIARITQSTFLAEVEQGAPCLLVSLLQCPHGQISTMFFCIFLLFVVDCVVYRWAGEVAQWISACHASVCAAPQSPHESQTL